MDGLKEGVAEFFLYHVGVNHLLIRLSSGPQQEILKFVTVFFGLDLLLALNFSLLSVYIFIARESLYSDNQLYTLQETFWQSEGSHPHFICIQFYKKVHSFPHCPLQILHMVFNKRYSTQSFSRSYCMN